MANFAVKPLGSEIAVTAANTVSNATCVRIYASAAATITVAHTGTGTSDPSITGTFTMPAGSIEYVKKAQADTIAASASVNCCPVAFY